MTISYSDITRKIKEAVPIAAATSNQPEAKLRELVAPLWDEYLGRIVQTENIWFIY